MKKKAKWNPLGTQVFMLMAVLHVVLIFPFNSLYSWAWYLNGRGAGTIFFGTLIYSFFAAALYAVVFALELITVLISALIARKNKT